MSKKGSRMNRVTLADKASEVIASSSTPPIKSEDEEPPRKKTKRNKTKRKSDHVGIPSREQGVTKAACQQPTGETHVASPASIQLVPPPTVTAAMRSEAEHTMRVGITSFVLVARIESYSFNLERVVAAHKELLEDAGRTHPLIDPNSNKLAHALQLNHIELDLGNEVTSELVEEARSFLKPLISRYDSLEVHGPGDSLLYRIALNWSINDTTRISWVWLEAVLAVPGCPVESLNVALLLWAANEDVTTSLAMQLLLNHGAEAHAVDENGDNLLILLMRRKAGPIIRDLLSDSVDLIFQTNFAGESAVSIATSKWVMFSLFEFMRDTWRSRHSVLLRQEFVGLGMVGDCADLCLQYIDGSGRPFESRSSSSAKVGTKKRKKVKPGDAMEKSPNEDNGAAANK